jgi:hypothetical protein
VTAQVRSAGDLLVSVLRADGSPVDDAALTALRASEWAKVPRAAAFHRVGSAAHISLRASRVVPAEVQDQLSQMHDQAVQVHLLAWQVALDAVRVLDDAGIAYALLKGPALAETVYTRPDLRSYGDIDLLVDAANFERAVDSLEASGATLIERNWDLIAAMGKGELNLVHPLGVPIDLHWSALYDAPLRAAFAWRDSAVLERRTPQVIAGTEVFVLSPEDQLLHLCMHACLAGLHRLSWLQDIRLAASRTTIDWDSFTRRSTESGLDLVVSVAFDRVRQCLGDGPLPPRSAAPRGRAWRRAMQLLGAVRPTGQWHEGRVTGHLLLSGTRRTSMTSAITAMQGTARGLRELARDTGHPWRGGARQPNVMRIPSSTDDGRRLYMAAVRHTKIP